MNGGSSSVKFAVFESGRPPTRSLAGAVERIGLPDAVLRVAGRQRRPIPAADFDSAVAGLLDWLDGVGHLHRIAAVGHRIVVPSREFEELQNLSTLQASASPEGRLLNAILVPYRLHGWAEEQPGDKERPQLRDLRAWQVIAASKRHQSDFSPRLGFIYVMWREHDGIFKIGRSKEPGTRKAQLEVQHLYSRQCWYGR